MRRAEKMVRTSRRERTVCAKRVRTGNKRGSGRTDVLSGRPSGRSMSVTPSRAVCALSMFHCVKLVMEHNKLS